ncbi:MAG: CopD family protein [Haloarculaceae archaeon]
MSALDTAMYATHLLFAGLWAGSVVFVTWGVLPTAMDGRANAEPLAAVVGRLRTISRASALFLLVSGGHMASQGYDVASLTGSTRGHLVLGMVALWLALMGLVEVASGKLADGFDRKKVREPAREARPFLRAASAVAVLLLLVGGVLAGGIPV